MKKLWEWSELPLCLCRSPCPYHPLSWHPVQCLHQGQRGVESVPQMAAPCNREQTPFLRLGKWSLSRIPEVRVSDCPGVLLFFQRNSSLSAVCVFVCHSAGLLTLTKGVLLFLRLETFRSQRGWKVCKGETVAKAHVPQASPRIAWTCASETKVLVRPGCLHSWLVFWVAWVGKETRKQKPLSSSIMQLREASGKQMASIKGPWCLKHRIYPVKKSPKKQSSYCKRRPLKAILCLI